MNREQGIGNSLGTFTQIANSPVDWLLILWAAGAIIVAVYFVLRYRRLRRALNISMTLPPTGIADMLNTCRKELGIKKKMAFSCHLGLTTTALVFPARVLIPADILKRLTPKQAKMALRHELAHYKRKDHIICLLMVALQAVLWFNPIIWMVGGKIRERMEICCDRMVVKDMRPAQKTNYVRALLAFYTWPGQNNVQLNMAVGNSRCFAKKRIRLVYSGFLNK